MRVHLRDTTKKPEDWKHSPHIFKALNAGIYAACRAGICDANHVTTLTTDVTCKACLAIIDIRQSALRSHVTQTMTSPYQVTAQMRRDFDAGLETPEILAVQEELSIEIAEQGLDREMHDTDLDQHREKRLLEIFKHQP